MDFLVAYWQRLGHEYYPHFLTVTFPKEAEREFLGRFYALKNAFNYIYVRDKTVIALAREEKFSDGVGFHAHAIIITRKPFNYHGFLQHAKAKAPIPASFHIEFVTPRVENVLRATAYVIKNREEVIRVWEQITGKRYVL